MASLRCCRCVREESLVHVSGARSQAEMCILDIPSRGFELEPRIWIEQSPSQVDGQSMTYSLKSQVLTIYATERETELVVAWIRIRPEKDSR